MTRSPRRSRPLALTLGLLASVFIACGNGGGSSVGDGATLEGATWVLDRTSIENLAPGAPGDARVDLIFEDDAVAGTSGCNSYFGSYEVDGGSISFGPLGGTEMACEPALMDLESAYLAALGDVRDHQGGDGELVLSGDEVRLVFREEEAPEPVPLVGTTWRLESLALATDAVASPVAGTEVTLELLDDDSATGSGGCNTFRTTYVVDGTSIGFDPVASTRMACEPEVMSQETAVFGALESAASFGVEGDVLTLLDADGRFLVSFRASP